MLWRLVDLGKKDPYFISALQEMLRRGFDEGVAQNSIILARFSEPTAWIGLRTSSKELHEEYCEAQKIVVVRGDPGPPLPLYYDSSHIIGHFAWKPVKKASREEALILLQNGVAQAARIIGLDARRRIDGNDVLVGTKKIASMGMFQYKDAWITGFSILCNFDFDVAEKAIIPKRDMRETMTTINAEADRDVPFEEIVLAVKEGFESILGEEVIVSEDLTESENQISEGLMEKYQSEEWLNRGRWSPVKDYWRPG